MTTSISILITSPVAGLTSTQVTGLTTDELTNVQASGFTTLQAYVFTDSTFTFIKGTGQAENWLPLPSTDARVQSYQTQIAQQQMAAAMTAQYNAALAAGIAITSTSTPALNGIYDISASTEGNWAGSEAAVSAGVFRGYYRTLTGTKVAMTAAQFTALAEAAYNLIAELDDALNAALTSGTFIAPPNAVTIP